MVELLLALLTTLTGIPRTVDADLTALAQQRAVEIQSDFSHNGVPAGLGEIIAWNNNPDPVGTFAAQWQSSPPHWAILTDPSYGEWGCGISTTTDGRYFGVCLFSSGGPVIQPTPAPPVQLPNTALSVGEAVAVSESPHTGIGSSGNRYAAWLALGGVLLAEVIALGVGQIRQRFLLVAQDGHCVSL